MEEEERNVFLNENTTKGRAYDPDDKRVQPRRLLKLCFLISIFVILFAISMTRLQKQESKDDVEVGKISFDKTQRDDGVQKDDNDDGNDIKASEYDSEENRSKDGADNDDNGAEDKEEDDLQKITEDEGEYVENFYNKVSNEENSNAGESNVEAERLINLMKKELGDSKGPIIVGGIGDSGTRGARSTLMMMGVSMLTEKYINPVSKDSEIFMSLYDARFKDGKVKPIGPHILIHSVLAHSHSLNYNSSHVSSELWHAGRQFVAKVIRKSLDATIEDKSTKRNITNAKMCDPWGFKHPRTSLLLPIFKATLGSSFKFVHVLRDGKDVVFGNNDRMFRDLCTPYFGKACPNTMVMSLKFWAELNKDIFEWAAEHLSPAQYFPLRIEDLVSGNKDCYKLLADFVGSPYTQSELDSRINKAAQINTGFKSSYFGNHYDAEMKMKLATHVNSKPNAKGVNETLTLLGYNQGNNYSLKGSCKDLLNRFTALYNKYQNENGDF